MTNVPVRPDETKLYHEFHIDVDHIAFVTRHSFKTNPHFALVKMGKKDPTKEELMGQLSNLYGIQVKELEFYIHHSEIVCPTNYVYNGRNEINLEDALKRTTEDAHSFEQGFDSQFNENYEWLNAVQFFNARHGKEENYIPSPYDIFLDNLEDYTNSVKDRATFLRDHKHEWPAFEDLGNYESRCRVCGMNGDI